MGLFASIKKAVAPKPDSTDASEASIVRQPARSENRATTLTECSGPSKVKRILFVLGNAAALPKFERELKNLNPEWRCCLVAGAAAALQSAATEGPFDAVITDLQLLGSDGIDLLNQITKTSPVPIRLVRCAASERALLKNVSGPAPQPIAEDAGTEAIHAALERGFILSEWMSDEGLKTLLPRIRQLPSLPTLYTQVMGELQKPDGSIDVVAKLIAQDPVMTAKMLQVVNSPYFALTQQIIDPADAVMFLGTERTKSLILLAKVFSQFDEGKCAGFSVEALWQHSMAVGAFARAIAMTQTRDAKLADVAFTAGLLHDVGKLFLGANLPTEYSQILAQAERRSVAVRVVEQEALGATHAELGASLLGTWGLPLAILKGIAWHHAPRRSRDSAFSVVTAVHVANVVDYEKQGRKASEQGSWLEDDYLEILGLSEEVNRWRTVCGVQTKSNAQALAEKIRRQGQRKCA